MRILSWPAGLVLAVASVAAGAKPIAYQNGSTVMFEYGGETMQEAQVFHAPRYWWSGGAGWLRLEADDGAFAREITYARLNLLVKRWNLPGAQANVFAWGGAGTARGSDFGGSTFAPNAGLQADYETRRVYGSLKSDYQYSRHYAHRIDTLQLGLAPYEHEYGTPALWFLVQGRTYTGGLYDDPEAALLLRLFQAWSWGSAWGEAGVTQDGAVQSMFMFNF